MDHCVAFMCVLWSERTMSTNPAELTSYDFKGNNKAVLKQIVQKPQNSVSEMQTGEKDSGLGPERELTSVKADVQESCQA